MGLPQHWSQQPLPGKKNLHILPKGRDDISMWLGTLYSIDWFKGKNIGKSHLSWENLWFPVEIFP